MRCGKYNPTENDVGPYRHQRLSSTTRQLSSSSLVKWSVSLFEELIVLISRPTKEVSRVSHEALAQLTDSAIMKEDAKLMPEVHFTS